ncbi:ERI1 exoribonuclease 2-like [Salvelinus fontinalis]|uniref:ERI1 exoribonuclease 2-like n=1 Tax=Salvelinus fontinalis TaxID=8038 RepID=UPI002486828C|nr:ERI1 exoribonuclease 2-like [Salvelinus fontinalis]
MSTKKLAKQLGFVRKRSQSSTGQKKPLTSNQIFPYLIVIDFESTCWRERNSYGQEIIEFPAVLLNTSTGEVESEFHTYVQPQEHPTLSDFCTELTGITQQQVEAGVPLHICLSRFSRWLQALEHQRGVVFPRDQRAPVAEQRPCAFVTWSDWDLGVCLLYECKRKQLHKPAVLNSWIDLRATYRLFYNRKPKGLNGALQDLGIQFSGREHSGLDDARNTAHLAWRMMRDGCVMKITRSLERAPLKTKPLFGNGNGCPSNKGDNKTTIKNPSKTTESGGHLENRPNSKPVSNTDVVETRAKPSDNPVPNTEVNSNLTAEPVQYQSIVSPKTLLNGLTTPMCGSSGSSRTVRIGTIRSVSSPMTFNIPSPHHYINSLVLVSTTVNCITHLPQPDPTLDPETGSMEEDVPILVETESCGSYDDVVLEEDCDVTVGDEDSVADVYTENERFEVDDSSVCGRTLLCPSPVHSNPGRGPTNSRPSSNTTNTPCQHLTRLVHKSDSRTSSSNLVSLKAETTRTYNTSAPTSLSTSSFVKPRPVTPGSNLSDTRSRLTTETSFSFVIDKDESRSSSSSAKAETTRIYNTSGSNSSCSFSFAKPRPVTHDSNRSATRSRPQTATSSNSFVIYKDKPRVSNTSSTSSISISSNTSTASSHSFVKPRPGLQSYNLHATRSRPLTTKNPGNYFTSMSSTTNLPNPSFVRPKPVTTSSNLSASHTQTPNSSASNLSFARPRPVVHNLNPSTSRSRLHAETPKASFTIHKDSSCLPSVSRTSVGGSFSILSSSVNRSSFPPTRSTKITAPLCDCGRRAKRLTVCNGGPNQGRAFYCCAVRKHGPGGTRKGCELFKWESALLQAKSPASSAASIALCFGLNSSVVRPPVII